jgi:hypothetical protein
MPLSIVFKDTPERIKRNNFYFDHGLREGAAGYWISGD